jgi:hypothetical protein
MREVLLNDVQTLINPLKEEIKTFKDEKTLVRKEMDDLEMYNRRSCVGVAGVPETEEHLKTDVVVMRVAEKLDIPITKEHISVSHRVGLSKPYYRCDTTTCC